MFGRYLAARGAALAHLSIDPKEERFATALGGSGTRAAACGWEMGQENDLKRMHRDQVDIIA